MTKINLDRYANGWERRSFTQEELIRVILERAFYSRKDKESTGDKGNIITAEMMINDLKMKRAWLVTKKLVDKKIIRINQEEKGFELIEDQSKCLVCWRQSDNEYQGFDNKPRPNERKVFDYERAEHLRLNHYYTEDQIERAGGIDKLFTKEDLPLKTEHNFKFISLEDNKAIFQCVNCDKEIHEYLDVKNCDNGLFRQ